MEHLTMMKIMDATSGVDFVVIMIMMFDLQLARDGEIGSDTTGRGYGGRQCAMM